MSQKIRIKLKSFDHALVDKSADKIVKTVKATGAVVNGPIPLPTDKKIFTVNRSTFVNKKSREQFELNSYRRLLDIYSSTPSTVDALMKLELPSGGGRWFKPSRVHPQNQGVAAMSATPFFFPAPTKALTFSGA